MMINTDISEILEFKNKIVSGELSQSMVLSEISTQSTISLTDDFLNVSQKKTLAEIQECQQPCVCVTLATVLSVETERGWYYNSCKKCSKKVIPDGTGFYFQLRVIDDSGSASLILFDREVVQFLQSTAAQLNQQVLMTDDMNKDKENNINHPKPVYTVNRLSSDKTLIDGFLKKSILIEVSGNSKFKYDATIRETNSVTYDNEEADITSPHTLTPLKRKNSTTGEDDSKQGEHQMSSNKQKIIIKKEKD
uniref:Replication factor A C-terminal domain-containing protein n=1 Tax=Ananas comosus var. bracteatus TaxID=296719 RepID=A0A6V7QK61_ANACO|nr:unnamed protein product [Ananas comosus var. bracteatus]